MACIPELGSFSKPRADLVLLFLQLMRECSEPLHLLLLETFYYKKMFLEPEETSQSQSLVTPSLPFLWVTLCGRPLLVQGRASGTLPGTGGFDRAPGRKRPGAWASCSELAEPGLWRGDPEDTGHTGVWGTDGI